MFEENVDIRRRLFERINAGDVDGELELIHPDIEWYARPDDFEGRLIRGREDCRAEVVATNAVFADYRLEVEEYIDAGEHLLVIGRARGKGRTSGVRLEDFHELGRPRVWSWRFRDGMGIECREFRTKEEALEAVGVQE
jgi:ketosteroid isomerase-like protein